MYFSLQGPNHGLDHVSAISKPYCLYIKCFNCEFNTAQVSSVSDHFHPSFSDK